MPTAWLQRLLTGLWALPRELGRLPEYATEVERLHREIRAGDARLPASGEKLAPPPLASSGQEAAGRRTPSKEARAEVR